MLSMSVWRTRLLNIALLLTVLVISLGIGEGVLRAVVRLPLQRVLPEVKYAHHPVRRFTLLPNQTAFSYGAPAHIDGRGFRTNSVQPPAPGERADVLALGDSFTFGMGVRDNETWPARLEQQLSQALARRVDVVNAGTISYGVFQEMDLLKSSGLATRPRVLIHALYWNDFMNASAPKPGSASAVDENGYFTWDQLGQPRSLVRRVTSTAVSSSALLYTLKQVAAGRAGADASSYGAAYVRFLEKGITKEEWQPVEDFYEELKALAAEHDFAVVSVVMPVSGIIDRNQAPEKHPYPVAAREMLERLGIPYLDTFGLWSGRTDGARLFLPQGEDSHLNPEGYELVSNALAKAVLGEASVRERLAR
jgi:lysophospholipase L1-like esterase